MGHLQRVTTWTTVVAKQNDQTKVVCSDTRVAKESNEFISYD
jgi:hypothetical protein